MSPHNRFRRVGRGVEVSETKEPEHGDVGWRVSLSGRRQEGGTEECRLGSRQAVMGTVE
jgi:hypothetical protein